MHLAKAINLLRQDKGLSQEQFASLFGVSQQSVQKWENGNSVPELSKIIEISKYFGVSLDALIMGSDNRLVEVMQGTKIINPQYVNIHDWEFYASNLMTEYTQSLEEGLDIEQYKDLFKAVSALSKGEYKKKLGDVLFSIVQNAPKRENYCYTEPSDLTAIKCLRKPYTYENTPTVSLEKKIHGAWVGRICGCLLGKTVECIHTDELIPFLKETGNYPLHRYILKSDLTDKICAKYKFPFASRCFADDIDGVPSDDDTNYLVMAQEIIERYGKDFTAYDVSRAWISLQRKDEYCTAERVAYCNFIKGYEPPLSAIYKNPFREWIGAQIRGDYFGYINPNNPELAADMAFRDASISHTKNGIYGEMFVSAMLATAGGTDNFKDIILSGLAQIPATSRLYESVITVVHDYENGVATDEVFKKIHTLFDEYSAHGWTHTISNAMIVSASLLYGGGDYEKSVCMAVETGFDTDCNGATVGSVIGMAKGIDAIPDKWKAPINDTLHTTLFNLETVKISDRVDITLKHINK